MNYPDQPEILLTARQAHLFIRLLKAMADAQQAEQTIEALETVKCHGFGSVTIRYKAGQPWLIDVTMTNNLKE